MSTNEDIRKVVVLALEKEGEQAKSQIQETLRGLTMSNETRAFLLRLIEIIHDDALIDGRSNVVGRIYRLQKELQVDAMLAATEDMNLGRVPMLLKEMKKGVDLIAKHLDAVDQICRNIPQDEKG